MFIPPEGKVSLKGGRWPRGPVCGGGHRVIDLPSARMVGSSNLAGTSHAKELKQMWRRKKWHGKMSAEF